MPGSDRATSPSTSPPPIDSDDEMDQLMAAPQTTSPDPPEFPNDPASLEDQPNDSQAAAASAPTATEPEGGRLHRVGIPRNELTALRNAGRRLKLHPYQQQEAEDLFLMSPALRDTHLFMFIAAQSNRLEHIIASAPPFAVNSYLLHNMKSFNIAVLLSSKIASYKGVVPRDHVLALIMRDRLHIPNTFERDPSAAKTLKEAVNHELSQTRSKLKKLIKANEEMNVYELATLLVVGTSCTVSVPLCGRIALFRKVVLTTPGSDFWDAVDKQLQKLRKKATDRQTKVLNQNAINQYFTNILDMDLKAYPSENGAAAPTNLLPTDEWQLGVDRLIAGESAASVSAH